MGYKYSTDIIDQTCPVVDDLTQTCLSLIDDDFRDIGLEGGYDNEIWKLVEKRVNTLVGKIKENATEKMRDALDMLVNEVNSLEDDKEELEDTLSKTEDQLCQAQSDVEYWEDQYNSTN